jgi:hypothetical protein
MAKGTGEAFVYYIRRGDLIKIGTSVHLRARLSAQAYDELLAVEPGYLGLEKRRHGQFAEHKKLGRGQHEWFKPGETLLAHVAALRALYDLPDLPPPYCPRLGPDAEIVLPLLPHPLIQVPAGTVDRLIAKITIDGESGCWRRSVRIGSKGYSQFWFDGRLHQAHRVSHVLFVGPIPDGYEVDHVKARGCRFKNCIRPSHLEAVTGRENSLRGGSVSAVNARVTHCPQGHEYTPDNIYWVGPKKNGRQCKTCTRAKARAQHETHRTGDGPVAVSYQLAKTHCPHGHPYSGDNLRIGPAGDRVCIECSRASVRRSRQRKRDREAALLS